MGRNMSERLRASGWRVISLSRSEFDVTSEVDTERAFKQAQPALVVNCAATTDVDRCERESDWAYAVNETGPRLLSRACRHYGAELVHVSTDYVFDGSKDGLYTQQDVPNPLSVYARSKLAGETAVCHEAERFYIVRTSWLFGLGGKNFGSRVLELARAGAAIKGVVDQISIPTYAPDLASRIEEIVNLGAHGLYHVTNAGPTSWYEFAKLALELGGLGSVHIEPVTRADLRQAAPRPSNTAMRCLLSEKLGLPTLRHWREALADFVREEGLRRA